VTKRSIIPQCANSAFLSRELLEQLDILQRLNSTTQLLPRHAFGFNVADTRDVEAALSLSIYCSGSSLLVAHDVSIDLLEADSPRSHYLHTGTRMLPALSPSSVKRNQSDCRKAT
jgi:hypothetical protein